MTENIQIKRQQQKGINWLTGKSVSIQQSFFIPRFEEGKQKVWKPCPTYLLDQGYNSGCLFKTEGHTLAFSIMNSNGSEERFSKILKSDFYSKYVTAMSFGNFSVFPQA